MSRILMICCVLFFAVSLVSGYAGECGRSFSIDEESIDYERTPVNKLGRGFLNTATSWTEIPGHVAKISNEKDPLVGLTMGVLEGAYYTVLRVATGLYEVLTFVVPPYDKPVMLPEYAMEEADDNFHDYLW